ncbi:biotin transporter BioY [Desulforamulus hydrothermalis]|uniref:Biotin transporter n=1 Tax=Desulforamulus hydrothermalis Lam5 = DSM 18033 TaxID=1121428 RepID=K8DZU5_9FIRM|nr:biotin transporter BioY [Desulforamulus hydrothermalis]CCO08684.1 BioY protein [Desulforamulus hydrothermalis Lam5 = DSM 18033]SHH38589.1 biotin transport system substrate-specific component [Desulforamulus hydrothermalis Lam5 = DSM 18033]
MKLTSKEIALAGLMAAVMVVVTVITRIPFVYAAIPFSLQPLVAVLAGVLLGPRIGTLSVAVYLLLGLLGLPVFATQPFGGIAYVLKPTFGFLLGQCLAAYAAGKMLSVNKKRNKLSYLTAALAGMAVIYLVGLPYVYIILNFYLGKAVGVMGVLKMALLPFVLWDVLKAGAVAVLALAIHSRLPELSPALKQKLP